MGQDHNNHGAQKHGGDETADTTPPIHQPRDNATKPETDAEQTKRIDDLQEESRRIERGMFRLAWFGFFVAFVSLVISTMQWWVMKQQLDDARAASVESNRDTERLLRANEKLAEATRVQAEGTRELARVTKEANLRFERAALKIDQVWSEPLTLPVHPITLILGKPMTAYASIGNDGRVTASTVEVHAVAELVRGRTLPTFERQRRRIVTSAEIAGNSSLRFEIPVLAPSGRRLLITQDVVDAFQAKQVRVFLHGQLRYTDKYGGDCWRNFCWRLETDQHGGGWAQCQRSNNGDCTDRRSFQPPPP